MDYGVVTFVDNLTSGVVGLYYSPLFLVFKILIAIYVVVVFADIVLLLVLRDITWDLRVGTKGSDIPLISKNKMQKRWDKIKDRLKSENVSQYKVAIIEADALVEELLAGVGFRGENMTQKLEQVSEMHLDDHRETLSEVHKLRNRIVHETDFEVDRQTTQNALEVYENFLRYLEFLQ